MKNLPAISLFAASLVIAPSPALAAEVIQSAPLAAIENQQQGLGLGTVVGAIVAGPVGAVIGAGFGGVAGWGTGMEQAYQGSQSELRAQKAQLQRSQTALKKSQTALLNANAHRQPIKPQLAEQRANQPFNENNESQLSALLKTITIDFHFQTNSAVVEPHYYPRLKAMAAQLQTHPEIQLHLTGYADHRGNRQYNLTLAENRARALSSLLINHGLDPQKISLSIKGEENALSTQNSGLLPFDRKVEIRFRFAPTAHPIASRGLIL
ncbi:OmpA family protein [Motiliproteus sp. MSK22-1]|uniref:OmpA family protein n=1 Tax=Motiliproteus sp. MSK22-1 TaxID=1897630 RepID=UPI0009778A64|nr:OmpA family protein [Motiliproteus sp. MSK22-1]OMH33915.1 hypothetical protein BGP75_13155 [Motiliproteus sp. MSK22-1]